MAEKFDVFIQTEKSNNRCEFHNILKQLGIPEDEFNCEYSFEQIDRNELNLIRDEMIHFPQRDFEIEVKPEFNDKYEHLSLLLFNFLKNNEGSYRELDIFNPWNKAFSKLFITDPVNSKFVYNGTILRFIFPDQLHNPLTCQNYVTDNGEKIESIEETIKDFTNGDDNYLYLAFVGKCNEYKRFAIKEFEKYQYKHQEYTNAENDEIL